MTLYFFLPILPPSLQIEQQAIAELRKLYAAQDNPDEYITVERCWPPGPEGRTRPVADASICRLPTWKK